LPLDFNFETKIFHWSERSEFLVDLFPNGRESVGIVSDQPEYTENHSGLSLMLKREKFSNLPTQFLFGYTFDWKHISEAYFVNRFNNSTSIEPFQGFKRSIHAFILQTDSSLTENFSLLLGVRNDFYSDLGYNPSPRVAFIFRPNDSSSLKLLYGRAFRAPGFAELAGSSSLLIGNQNISPETIHTEELIYLKKHFRYSFSSSLYYSQWENGIILERDFRYSNNGKNRAYGLEAEFNYFPMPVGGRLAASFNRSVNIAHSNFQDYSAFPTFIMNWSLDYNWKATGLSFQLFNRHEFSRTEGTSSASPKLENYFRTDFNTNWDVSPLFGKQLEQYQIALSIKNLFNRTNFHPSLWDIPGGFQEPGMTVLLAGRITL
jgi:iron complex outermembrane receptor protein